MRRELLPLYGPFSIQSYGLAIIVGIIIFSWLFLRETKKNNLLNYDQYSSLLTGGIISAIIGARILAILTSPEPLSLYHLFIDGGLSVLGSILALLLYLPLALRYMRIPVKELLDIIGLYAPLLQAISRIGCLSAGCCYGCPTNHIWGITYTNSDSLAPMGYSLHPTQLYSAILLFCLFSLLYYYKNRLLKSKTLLEWYLCGMASERFIVDFFRADREWLSGITMVSAYQLVSIVVAGVSIMFIAHHSFSKLRKQHYESL